MMTAMDAFEALTMVGRGLGMLLVYALTCIVRICEAAVGFVVKHPRQIITALLAIVLGALFIPGMIAFTWFMV